jgi:UDP:flavonoid glycosyltransferase YjiC (YdhE family)
MVSPRRIMVFPFNLMSHYLRCISLASRYLNSEILIARSEEYNQFVTRAGFGSFDVKVFDSADVLEHSNSFSFDWLNYDALKPVFESQVEVIKTHKPHLVIGDTSPTLKMAAEFTNTPYTSLMNGYMTRYYSHTRRVPRFHPAYKYSQIVPENIFDPITRAVERTVMKSVHRPFKKIRKEHGLSALKSYLEEMEGDENLICDSPEIFPQTNLPDNYTYTGELELVGSGDSEIPTLSNKPLILICMGSSGSWDELQFLTDQRYSSYQIIAAGDTKRALKADHIESHSFIELDELIKQSEVFICHGGNGTLMKAHRHNKFALCLTSHFEQEWNVQRIEEMGFGKSINDDPERMIRQHLEELSLNTELQPL